MNNSITNVIRTFLYFVFFGFATTANATISTFFTSLPAGTGNVSGMAINPVNGNIVVGTLSYGGQDNLWEFTSSGTFIGSSRANYAGALGPLTFGANGHLYATRETSDAIMEMSPDGSIVYSTISTSQFTGGVFGLTYDTANNRLVPVTGYVNGESIIREIALDGTLFNSSAMNVTGWPNDVAYDPFSGNLFALRGYSSSYNQALDEYAKNGAGQYTLVNSYGHIFGSAPQLDINRTTGLFYAGGSGSVSEFSLSDLSTCLPTCALSEPPPPPPSPTAAPVPASIWLLGSGLLGLAGMVRCRKAHPVR